MRSEDLPHFQLNRVVYGSEKTPGTLLFRPVQQAVFLCLKLDENVLARY